MFSTIADNPKVITLYLDGKNRNGIGLEPKIKTVRHLWYGGGNVRRDRGIYERVGRRHILTVFSEPKNRAQNLRFQIYQW